MNLPPVLSVEQVRRVDRYAIEQLGVPGIVLMENAGRGAVEALLEFDPAVATGDRAVGILCGKGNNAGDGLVVARRLAVLGVPATLALLCDPGRLAGDAATNYAIVTQLGLPCHNLSGLHAGDAAAIAAALDERLSGSAWLIDALLGTGATGEPRPPFDAAVAWANAQPAQRFALDVPTGLNADTGAAAINTFRADLTCTFAAMKQGFAAAAAAPLLGELRVADIGLPASAIRAAVKH